MDGLIKEEETERKRESWISPKDRGRAGSGF